MPHSLPVVPTGEPDEIADALTRLNVGEIRFDRHSRQLYSTDASLYQVDPIGVVLPRDAEQIRRLCQFCTERQLPILPRGGGTSLAGQCTNRAIVVDLSPHLRQILDVDPIHRTCRVEPGISIDALNHALADRKTGLYFAADPATMAQASIGGCIGNNAAGARSIRYGRTSENLAGVECVLPCGEFVRLAPGAGRRDSVALGLARQVAQIVRANESEIRKRFPKLVRRNAGYALDLILAQLDAEVAEEDIDLSGLICGSEGSLAIVVAASLKLHPTPLARGLAVISFADLDAAIAAVPAILQTRPTAVELLDHVVLSAARGNTQCRPYVDLLPRIDGASPEAALYVEYQAEQSTDELQQDFAKLKLVIGDAPIAVYVDREPMNQLWTLRKNSEALLHALSATRKPITFVEDNAVPVEQLSHFVREFRNIVESHGTDAAYYAHASVGVLHVRPMLDVHDPEDLEKLRAIAVAVADLAKSCGGVMSGEHGDGRVRGPLLESFYGPELLTAFAAIKRIFDPSGILNPNMIVNTGPVVSITQNLRVQRSSQFRADRIETYFDYHEQDGFVGAFEMCNGAGFCRKTSGGTMCPSYRATLDERHSTRGRANALRELITAAGPVGPNWDDPDVAATLDLCLSCKACKTECPSNVDLAKLKAEFTAQRDRAAGGAPRKAKWLGNVRRLNRLGAISPKLSNALLRSSLGKALAYRLAGISPKRRLPTFSRSLYRHSIPSPARSDAPTVMLFADCFTTYNESHIGRSAMNVLTALGWAIRFPRVGCCGRAMISNGLLPDAQQTIDATLADLAPFIFDPKIPAIIVCEPSCLSAMKDDWLSLKLKTPIDLRRKLAEKAMLAEEFVERFWTEHPTPPRLDRPSIENTRSAIFHGHCHQKAIWGEGRNLDLLRRLLGERLRPLDSGCCGMAGGFGYAAEHHDLSLKIGELSVFPPIRSVNPDTLILAPGFSCRHQIFDGTGRAALHPIELIERMLQQ